MLEGPANTQAEQVQVGTQIKTGPLAIDVDNPYRYGADGACGPGGGGGFEIFVEIILVGLVFAEVPVAGIDRYISRYIITYLTI